MVSSGKWKKLQSREKSRHNDRRLVAHMAGYNEQRSEVASLECAQRSRYANVTDFVLGLKVLMEDKLHLLT